MCHHFELETPNCFFCVFFFMISLAVLSLLLTCNYEWKQIQDTPLGNCSCWLLKNLSGKPDWRTNIRKPRSGKCWYQFWSRAELGRPSSGPTCRALRGRRQIPLFVCYSCTDQRMRVLLGGDWAPNINLVIQIIKGNTTSADLCPRLPGPACFLPNTCRVRCGEMDVRIPL